MGFWSFLNILKRRWWLILVATAMVTSVVAWRYISMPKEWEGFATVAEYRSLMNNRTVIYPDTYSLQVDLITRLQNIANVIGSYTVILSTWRELRDSGRWRPAELIAQNYPTNERDFAGVLDLIGRLEIKPIPNTEYLSVVIRVQGDEENAPQQAQYAMEVLLRKFEEQYNSLNEQVAKPSRQFIEAQYAQAKRDYERASRNLSEYMDRNPDVIQNETQTGVLLNQISRTETQLYDAEVQQRSVSARLARLEQQFKSGAVGKPQKELSRVVRTNNLRQQLIQQLVQAQSELESQRAQGRGENHPEVLRAMARVDEVQKQLDVQAETILDSQSTGVNNLYDNLLREYLTAITENDAADRRVQLLRTQATQMRSRLNGLPLRQREVETLRLERQLAQDKVTLMQRKMDEATVREQELLGGQFIKRIDNANVRPVDRKVPLRIGLAFALSLILSTGLVLLLSQMDQSVYNPTQAAAQLGMPVVASLPRLRRALVARDHTDQSPLGASYQMLSTSLLGANGRLQGNTVAITGAEPNVGRSTVAYNLAVTLARDGVRVVLIDADMRQPSLHTMLRLENRVGLSEVLRGEVEPEQVVQMTPVEGLVFISAGSAPDNPIRLLHSKRMDDVLERLSQVSDFVVIDTPSGNTFADGSVTAKSAKNVLVVHAAGTPVSDSTREFLQRLEHLGVNLVGAVLNKVRVADSVSYQQYQRNYRNTLALRNGHSAARPALTSGQVETQEPEQTAPRDDQ